MKALFKIADKFLPGLAAKQVYKVMSNPRVRKLRSFEEDILNEAERERLPFNKGEVQVYKWGNPENDVIFLVHGWEGQAGNFGGLIPILLAKNYYVIAFDAPAHGRSSKQRTSMFEFVEVVTSLFKEYKPKRVISHSFGSITTLMTASNIPESPIEQWIVVTTPHNFKDRINGMKDFLGLTDRTIGKVVTTFEADTGFQIDDMNIEHYGNKIPHVKEVIIVHSKADKIIPIESARIAHKHIAQSELIELDGLGHYAILWSDGLKEIVEKRVAKA